MGIATVEALAGAGLTTPLRPHAADHSVPLVVRDDLRMVVFAHDPVALRLEAEGLMALIPVVVAEGADVEGISHQIADRDRTPWNATS